MTTKTKTPSPVSLHVRRQVEKLRQEAVQSHLQYPQYEGFFHRPDVLVLSISKRVRGKGGVMFEAGDLAFGWVRDVPLGSTLQTEGFMSLYSNRLGWMCSVPTTHFIVLGLL